jgi:GntR family transcriptional regulator
VLVLSSVSLGEGDRPVEFFIAHHRGDRSRFEAERARTSGPAAAPLMHVISLGHRLPSCDDRT